MLYRARNNLRYFVNDYTVEVLYEKVTRAILINRELETYSYLHTNVLSYGTSAGDRISLKVYF